MGNKKLAILITLLSVFVILLIANICIYAIDKHNDKHIDNGTYQKSEIVENDSIIVGIFYDDVEKTYLLNFCCSSNHQNINHQLHDEDAVRQYAKVGIHNLSAQYNSDTFNDDEFAILIKKYVQKNCDADGIKLDYFEIKRIN